MVHGAASSTSHVSISLGQSNVAYNNDHLPGASYGRESQFSITPFIHSSPSPSYEFHSTPSPSYHEFHSTPSPSYHEIIDHASGGAAFFAHSSPSYSHSPVRKYHSTPAPFFYRPVGKAKFVSETSSPEEKSSGESESSKDTEKKEEFMKPKSIEKEMQDLMAKGMQKEKEESSKSNEGSEEGKGDETKSDEEKSKASQITTSKPQVYHPSVAHISSRPSYGSGEEPLYIPPRHFGPHPIRVVHKFGSNGDHPNHEIYNSEEKPNCADGDRIFCDKDEEYPAYQVMNAAHKHAAKLLELYADVADLNTESSVELPKKADGHESYVCPADISYAQVYRAKNKSGKWRIIVNDVKVHYQTLTQTVRIEECLMAGENCPLVPHCFESKCLQKSTYHRFLVYDPYDRYFPFTVESFPLPSACACHLGEYEISH